MARSLSNSKVEDFEPRKKNPLGLLNDSNLDSHLKSLKIGDRNSPIQLSKNEVRFDADFSLNGKFKSHSLETDNYYMDFKSAGYFRFYSDDITDAEAMLLGFSSGGDALFVIDQNLAFTANDDINFTATTGNINLLSDVALPATKALYFDGGGNTFIKEVLADSLGLQVGGDYLLTFSEYGADGNETLFKTSCATFTRQEATFSATGVIASGGSDDTDIDFRHGNKYRLEMTADIHTMNLIFPKGSGNFVLVCTTNGDHDVSNWKVYESDESGATTSDVMWAGGSVPAFTNNGIDIVSFYWDATEQQCYGVASLAFATP